MIGRTVAFAACVCGFAILMVPREGADEVESAKSSVNAGSSTFAASTQSSWASGDHTLDRQSDGHFYASASVDGATIRMMVDTGASVIALTGADADAAGLRWDAAEIRIIGQGASGEVYGVPARLREVEIGGIVRRNVNAVIIPEGLGVSLLGQSWLAQVDGVEITDNQMVLRTN